MKKVFLFSLVLFAMYFVCFFAGTVLAATGTIDNTNKYAWGNKCGWINFAPTDGSSNYVGLTITDSAVTGYAWNQIYGWINFNRVTNTTSGTLSGYAWGENTGWINFSGVSISCAGKFTGTATGEITNNVNVVGTISFDCSNCNVTTNWARSSSCGGGPPQPPQPSCGDNVCNGTETCGACPADCGQCLPVCGDSTCNGVETCAICPADCGVCAPVCGDGACQNPETCELCSADCGKCLPKPVCGDGACNNNETCATCPGDCGACLPFCGDNVCNGTENCNTCSQDCGQCFPVCGDNICNGAETCGNCPLDCGSCDQGVPIAESHNECNSQKQCVSVAGSGADQCKADNDCAEKTGTGIIEIIETPIKIIETVTQIITEQIQTPQGSIVTKSISTTGAVVAIAEVAATIIFSPFEIFLILFRLFGIFLTAIGLKKRIKSWGVVYDSVTKQPLDPAYVVLKDLQGKNISSAITDLDGRYGFLVAPGIYQMSVNKTNYIFPSQKLAGRTNDELYSDLYFGSNMEIKQDGETIIKNIPMDPLKFDWNEFAKRDKKLMRFYSRMDVVLRKIFDLFFVVGFIVALVAYFAVPYPYNLIILIVYLVLLFLRTIGIKPKAYGRISSIINGDPLSFAVLRVMMPGTNVEIAHKVADKYGRYYCLVPKGQYFVKIEKKNDDGSYSLIYTSPIIDASKKGIIKNNFKI